MDKPIPEAVLLPCPMCGGDAALNTCRTTESEFIRLNGRDTGYGVNCVICGLNNRGFAYGYATPAEAITAWNRRTLTAAQQPDHIVDATKMVAQQQGQADVCASHASTQYCSNCVGQAQHPHSAIIAQPMQQGGGDVRIPSAAEWCDENSAEATMEWRAGWDACRVEYPRTAPPSAPDRDAYEGAREDLLDWKGRAQRAEATLRGLGYKGIDASEAPSSPVGVEE